ncbi:hypothetical protein R6Q59_010849 [Mikania micrantha]
MENIEEFMKTGLLFLDMLREILFRLKNMDIFYKPKIKPKLEIEEERDFMSLDEFRTIWSKARSLSQEDFENEHLYIEDKASISLIIFCPGLSPKMFSLAFSAEEDTRELDPTHGFID